MTKINTQNIKALPDGKNLGNGPRNAFWNTAGSQHSCSAANIFKDSFSTKLRVYPWYKSSSIPASVAAAMRFPPANTVLLGPRTPLPCWNFPTYYSLKPAFLKQAKPNPKPQHDCHGARL
ncbi:MAG TPA: hypothetical protein VNT00_06065 [Eoetvoesiella sp.]|uniref:hypothetical protein n=1 Tax=Eoetvoesiella sp. TaxID=1966355 RepID=UPI002C65B992|nr:hypothetical protein [Eoetvoesiella sp.]HWK60964.1 hypothetical protein [Eoetvoesiella sp.]